MSASQLPGELTEMRKEKRFRAATPEIERAQQLSVIELCRHQRKALDQLSADAMSIGLAYKVTSKEASDLETIMPIDLDGPGMSAFTTNLAQLYFFHEGCVCGECNHIAVGKLTQSSPEQQARWKLFK